MAAHGKKSLLGYTLMVFFVVMCSFSSVAVQSLERAVPDFQLGIFRYIGGALLASFPVYYSGLSIKVPTHLLMPVLRLAFYSMIYNLLFYFAVSVLPLSHASSLSYVIQTVVMAILSMVLLNEKGSLLMYTAVLGCVAGMLLVLQPWMDFNQGFTPGFTESTPKEINTVPETSNNVSFNASVLTTTTTTTTKSFNKTLLLIGYIAVVIAGGIEAFTLLLISKYLREVKSAMLVFYTSSISIIPQTLFWLYLEEPFIITDPYSMMLVALHAATLALGLMALNHACTLISPMQVALVFNFGSVVNVILQYTLLSGHLYGRRNVLEVVGCLLVTLSIMLSAVSNDKNHEDFNG